jgi:cytoskeletal protein CcmA (bactofilin family)
MSVEKKTIRSDIPGHASLLNGGHSYGASQQEESRRLVIGRGINLTGEIANCDHLVVEGTVNAQGFSARRVDILESGCFAGSGQAQDAVIAGRFEGKLTVPGRLTVKSTGSLYGEIHYGSIECEAGARIEGQMLAMPPAAAAQPEIAPALINDNVENLFEGSDDEESTEERPRVFRRAVGY